MLRHQAAFSLYPHLYLKGEMRKDQHRNFIRRPLLKTWTISFEITNYGKTQIELYSKTILKPSFNV